MSGPLANLRILDLTHYIVGPYCTKLLGDYGADVVKVERVDGGDPARRMRPFWRDDPTPEHSGLFLHLNTNKRSITLNLKSDSGRALFFELLAGADAVVHNFSPHVMGSFGLSYEAIARVAPRVVLTSITNFGPSGPYRDFRLTDIVLYAMGGEMYATGAPGREPLKLMDGVAQYQVSAVAAAATMGAIIGARTRGRGQHVEVSCFEAQVGSIDRRATNLLAYEYTGDLSLERRSGGLTTGFIPLGVFPCADGYFSITGMVPFWPRIVSMLGSPTELLDVKWLDPGAHARPELKEEFDAIFLTWTMARTKREIWAAAREAGMMLAPCYTMAELLEDDHFRDRNLFVEMDHPIVGQATLIGRPFIMSATPWELRRAAPLLGQHTGEILAELGYDMADIGRLREAAVV